MTRGIAWLARNPVAANLLMVMLVASGLLATTTIRQEVFPEVALDQISIHVRYLGAAPEDVEQAVVIRIEEAIQAIDGIRRIRSTASEGGATVVVELELGTDSRRVVDEVKNNVDAITTFPVETEVPIVRELIGRNQVVDVVASGNTDIVALKTLAERVRDELGALPEISRTDIVGAPAPEISIEVSEAALRRHGLTFDDVVSAVRRSSLDLPGGSVRTDAGEILLRTIGQAYRGADYEELVLWTRADGSRLRVGDVATVVDGFAETDQQARFDGEPAVMIPVFRTGDQNAVDISAAVDRYVENRRTSLPEGISLTVRRDESEVLNDRLSLMLGNGASGFLLVFVVLALFLELRLACWVAFGIPIAFLGAVAMMPALGASINVISIFAFVLVLGIVVDDAIVVGENVHRHQEGGGNDLHGGVEGAREIAKPVVFAVLTTVAAFLPLLNVPGIAGKSFRAIPLIVIPCLLVSLIESLGILPAHLAHGKRRGRANPWRRFQERFANGLKWFVWACYRPLLDAALRWRYLAAASFLSLLVLTAGLLLGGRTTFHFFPSIEPNYMTVSVTMPQGTPVGVTSAALARIEEGVARVRERLVQDVGSDYFRHVSTTVGDQPVLSRGGGPIGPLADRAASNVGEITIELVPAETREYNAEQLGAMWRDATPAIPDAVDVSFDLSVLNVGDDIDVQLAGPDLDQLRAAADAIKGRLVEYVGVYDVSDSFRAGKEEMRLRIRARAETLGLSLQDLGRQVRQAFYGDEAQRIQRGRDDVRVMVRYPREERRSLGNLERMRIRTADGGQVPFGEVAYVEPGRGYATITRVDRNRAVNVTAAVDPEVSSAGPVVADLAARILPDVLERYPGIVYSFQGAQAEQADAVSGLLQGLLLALLLIFALLAIPLRSYVQPLIIMAAIPFGFVGAIWGHILMGIDITMVSMFGLVALAGVVVNDSLVMVDFINNAMARRGAPAGRADDSGLRPSLLQRAIREAGAIRFRPILLTSLTTFVGLSPLMLDRSMQAMFLVPMAVSLAFGVLFATLVTLILVPIAYMILDYVRESMSNILVRVVPVGDPADHC